MHKTALLLTALLPLLFFQPFVLRAESQRITVTHTYVMGDSESRNEARANCLAEAKRKIAEQAGAYVEVLSKTNNFIVDEDAVLSFTAALVRLEVEEERFSLEGQSQAITLTVTGEVDPDAVKQRLEQLAQRRLAAREAEGSLLDPARPAAKPADNTPKPQETTDLPVAETMTPMPSASIPQTLSKAKDPRAAHKRLQKSLEETTELCMELTAPGMSRGEVEHLLGEPRAVKQNSRYNYTGAKYGHLWVIFRDDVVACIRTRLEYRRNAGGEAHCEGFVSNIVKR